MTESKQIELMNFVAGVAKRTPDGSIYIIEDMADFTEKLYKHIVRNTRCTEDLWAFIDYMSKPECQDMRFWQGVRAFTGNSFVLTAKDLDGKDFSGIEDTYYHEKAR